MRSIVQLMIGLSIAVALSGCADMGKDGGGSSQNVSATDNQFAPNTATLKENGKIVVKNDGDNLHSVTVHKVGDPATQNRGDTDIAKGASTEQKFEESGTYHVYCKYHSGGAAGNFGTGMVMTVTVNEA